MPPSSSTASPLTLDGQPLTLADVESVARQGRPVALGPLARKMV